MKALTFVTLLVGTTASVFAGQNPVPEIDAATGIGALTLISGGLTILRARRKK